MEFYGIITAAVTDHLVSPSDVIAAGHGLFHLRILSNNNYTTALHPSRLRAVAREIPKLLAVKLTLAHCQRSDALIPKILHASSHIVKG